MAVAHDAATLSALYTTVTPFDFTHTPVGTPRGVVLFITQENATDRVTGVTYGGVAMGRVQLALDTATELLADYCYFLGASIPTGPQTVSITHDGAGVGSRQATCITVTAAADTEVASSDVAQENQANPQILLASTGSALRYASIASGLPNTTDLTEVANSTRLFATDLGARVTASSMEDAPSTSFTIGWTSADDDVAMTAIAIQEIAVASEDTLEQAPFPVFSRAVRMVSSGSRF